MNDFFLNFQGKSNMAQETFWNILELLRITPGIQDFPHLFGCNSCLLAKHMSRCWQENIWIGRIWYKEQSVTFQGCSGSPSGNTIFGVGWGLLGLGVGGGRLGQGGGCAGNNVTEKQISGFSWIFSICPTWHKGNICWAGPFHAWLECFKLLKLAMLEICALLVVIISIVIVYQYGICYHSLPPVQDSYHNIAWNRDKTFTICVRRWTHQMQRKQTVDDRLTSNYLMAATWYLCYVMPSMQHYYHSGVSSFAAADLVHVGCKGICNIRTPVVAYQNHPHRNDHKVTLQTSTQSQLITCQNFQFWQVCSSDGLSVCLLLAKIFNFGKYVRLTVCLSVCLFVRMNVVSKIQVAPLDQSSPNLT